MTSNDDATIAALWRELDRIGDPCHVLSGHGLSIVDIGIVNRIERVGDRLEVGVTFTEAGCTFGYQIIEAIEDLAPKFPAVAAITVVPEHYPMWMPERLSDKARALFADKRAVFGFAGTAASSSPSTGPQP